MKLFAFVLAIAALFTLGCAGGPAANGSATTATAGGAIYSIDFETDAGAWAPKGTVSVGVSDEFAHSGKQSLKTSDRSQTWHAPELNITSMVSKDGAYAVSCWFLVPADSAVSAVKLTVQTTADGANNWIQIAKPVAAEPGKWVELSGTYNKSGSFEQITVYVEPSEPEGTFYVDDVTISAAAQ